MLDGHGLGSPNPLHGRTSHLSAVLGDSVPSIQPLFLPVTDTDEARLCRQPPSVIQKVTRNHGRPGSITAGGDPGLTPGWWTLPMRPVLCFFPTPSARGNTTGPHAMGPLAPAIVLSVLLDPAFLLTRELQDLPSAAPVPSLRVTFDPRKLELTWDCDEDPTYVECVMLHPDKGPISLKPRKKECRCVFPDCALHQGVTLSVTVNTSQTQVSEKLVYTNPGGEGTAAQNFSCFIYNVHFMNCTWAPGRAAPDDVQYFLYIRDSKKRERECPRYVSDSGTHVGCHLDDLSGLTSYNYFLVNGTSQTTGIQFFDSVLRSKQIERYSPPTNISVQCKPSSCLIRWERPSAHFRLDDRDFQYELVIQRQSRTQPPEYPMRIEVPGDSQNQYLFPSLEPRPKHTVKIRTGDARDARDPRWGAWSRPVEFGSEDPDAGVVHVYVLVVLGTLGCALALGCLVKRFLRRHSLFQPVPRIKDKLNDNHPTDFQDVWEEFPAGAGKAEHEEVVTVQEVDRAPVSG
ncbi:granulocyte-macrophage colony-stimulating factor receptor subunit alpha isoform X3 [Equus asinus]|uniref:granulocyte-macrophage colony-stimulating factor receptor subunit alpha isoform X3 n=1 Tax=Equus asinus TaxID=9793 RepID=UPI0038F615BA